MVKLQNDRRCCPVSCLHARRNNTTAQCLKVIKLVITALLLLLLFLQAGVKPTLGTHMLRRFYNGPIALTQEGSQVDDVCECLHD